MADSNITKRALATSLKELMLEQPFDKINVAQICARCNMNRKSFYYHFKDKYDLVNWIFDTEFIALMKDENLDANYPNYKERWVFMRKFAGIFMKTTHFTAKRCKSKGKTPSVTISVSISGRFWPIAFLICLGRSSRMSSSWSFLLTRCSVPWNAGC